MTFLQLYESVAANVWPDRPARNLVRTYKDWLRDALIQLQVRVVQGELRLLQEKHVEEVSADAMAFSCGASVWRMPRGTLREVRTELIANRCDRVTARMVSEREMKCRLEMNPVCGCATLTCGSDRLPYGYDVSEGYADEYVGGVLFPLGGVISSDTWTSEPHRPRDREFAFIDGFIWLWPEIHSSEVLVVTWDGVKRSWLESSIFGETWLDEAGGFDREVQEAIEEFLKSKDQWKKNCEKTAPDFSMFNDRVAGLIASRRKERTAISNFQCSDYP